MQDLFQPNTSGNTQKPPYKAWGSEYLLPFGSLLIAVLSLIVQKLPTWALLIAGSYLVVAAGAALYLPTRRLIVFASSRRKMSRLAKSTFPHLVETAKQLQRLIAQGQANTAYWDEIRSRSPLFDPEHLETIRRWLSSIEQRIEGRKRRDFPGRCEEFSDLVNQYNRLCCQWLQILQGVIATGRLPEQRLRYLKQQWNLQRDDHVAFIRAWVNLARTINAKAGRSLCYDYYQPLESLV